MDRVKAFLSSCALLCVSCTSASSGATSARAVPAQAPPSATSAAPAAPAAPAPDSVTAERGRYAREVLANIAGHESEPAGKVFKNLKTLTEIPASRLVGIMNNGYGRALGVSCSHCHVVGQWDSDSKPQKQIARDMVQMVSTINGQLLANIKNLKGPQAIVNCTTCHRGSIKPALNLGQ